MEPQQLGPYRIVRLLGRGGMGAVYEAIHDETDEVAAVKLLPAALAAEPDFRQRFSVEIETLRKLYHPNIVQLFGFGEQDGILFYAMELVEGSNLEQELRQGRHFDWREVVDIGIQTCRALRHAHDRGIIHRDIKPANLLWTADRRVKLSDFGIARLFGNTKLTAAGSVLGTAEYMAPEQADARPTGPRTDLYSLGGVLYCLTARRPPFYARSLVELIDKHRTAVPDPVRRYAPDCPAELEAIIAQLLSKSPDDRIPNATLVARRLESMRDALSVQPTAEEQKLLRRLQEPLGAEAVRPAQPETPRIQTPAPPDDVPPTVAAGADDGAEYSLGRAEGAAPAAGLPLGATIDAPASMLPKTGVQSLGATSTHVRASAADAAALPETRLATGPAEAAAAGASPADGMAAAGGESLSTKRFGGTFIPVGQEDLDPVEPSPPPHAALVSPQTWLLAGSLLAMGLAAWYLLQPATAEDLYGKICRVTAEQTVDSYVQAEPQIAEFLQRFPGDSRCEILQGYQREIDLNRLEKIFKERAKGRMAAGDRLRPIERAYLDAMKYAELDSDRGLAQLQAFVNLYCDRKDISGPDGECLALARRQLEKLQKQSAHQSAEGKLEIESRLAKADTLRATDPETARTILRSLVDLFGEKPWAAELIAQAKEALRTLPQTPRDSGPKR